jgi:regulator of replication initiation timing
MSEEDLPDALLASQEALRDAEEGLDEVVRLEVMGEGLEELGTIVASIEAATPRDLVFVENSTRLALSGYDISVESIFPSLESHHGTSISMESLSSLVKQIWKSIVKVIKRVWEDIMAFFKRMVDIAERLKMTNQKLRARIMDLDNKKILDAHTELGPEITHLSSDNKLPKNGDDIEKLIDRILHHASVVYGKYVTTIADAGILLAEAIERFDIDNPEKSLRRVVDSAKRIDFEAIEKQAGGTKEDKDRRWQGNSVKVSKPLGKDMSLFFIEPEVRGSEDSVLGQAERLRNRRVQTAKTSQGKDKKIVSGTIQTIPNDQMLKISQRNDELLKQITDFRKAEVRVIRSRRRLEAACAKLTKRMESQRDLSTTATQYYRAAANFSLSYARWCMEPQTRFTDMAIQAVRASITACNKSISNYGTP